MSQHRRKRAVEVDHPDWPGVSIFWPKYQISWIDTTDHSEWDKRWEKTFRRLSASKDVFPLMSTYWTEKRYGMRSHPSPGMPDDVLYTCLCRIQKVGLRFEEQLEEQDPYVIAWLLLDEADRKRHLFEGMKETCKQASFYQDGRALCPEITTTAMLKQSGKAFTDLARNFIKGTKAAGPGKVYLLPSEWWSSAVKLPQPWPAKVKFAFTQLTLQRNEFISHFVMHTWLSIIGELSAGSPAVDKVKALIEDDIHFAFGRAKTLSSQRDKPIFRCQNCTKSPEEIGGKPKFMVCSICKSKLDFVVHYCSRACQKDDWPSHKQHCGKEKIAKKLRGTIHDPAWQYPDTSDSMRSLAEMAQNGKVEVTSIGFGTPHPSRPHSPALQRQVALLESDKDADYILFDDADRPVRFVLHNTYLRLDFRLLRSEVMFGVDHAGAEIMAEFLIKVMGDAPGLSRATILAQFEREYGNDVEAHMAAIEAQGVDIGYGPEKTFFEAKSTRMWAVRAEQVPQARTV